MTQKEEVYARRLDHSKKAREKVTKEAVKESQNTKLDSNATTQNIKGKKQPE